MAKRSKDRATTHDRDATLDFLFVSSAEARDYLAKLDKFVREMKQGSVAPTIPVEPGVMLEIIQALVLRMTQGNIWEKLDQIAQSARLTHGRKQKAAEREATAVQQLKVMASRGRGINWAVKACEAEHGSHGYLKALAKKHGINEIAKLAKQQKSKTA